MHIAIEILCIFLVRKTFFAFVLNQLVQLVTSLDERVDTAPSLVWDCLWLNSRCQTDEQTT